MLLALMLLAQVTTAPADAPYPPDPACMAEDTVGMVECQKRDLAIWDGRLNREYRAAMQRVGPVSHTKLRKAQRLWIAFRDANCGVYAAHGGTIRALLGGSCMVRMTRERTLELRAFDSGYE